MYLYCQLHRIRLEALYIILKLFKRNTFLKKKKQQQQFFKLRTLVSSILIKKRVISHFITHFVMCCTVQVVGSARPVRVTDRHELPFTQATLLELQRIANTRKFMNHVL